MKLLVITLARNEEKIIPYFIHHYKDIADHIILVDHESTDNTVKIAQETSEKLKASVSIFTLKNDGYDDILLKQFKENFYKNFRDNFDVILICDTDEFWHHKDGTRNAILKCYEKKPFVIQPNGYHMISDDFPEYDGIKLTDKINEGARAEGFDKCLCFSTSLNLNGQYGMHYVNFFENHNLIKDSNIKLLHYKFLGLKHRIERIRNSKNNLSNIGEQMLSNGIAAQLGSTDEQLEQEFNNWYDKKQKIDI
jgi:glycosyltransferase involved in cell wall biosynthesis